MQKESPRPNRELVQLETKVIPQLYPVLGADTTPVETLSNKFRKQQLNNIMIWRSSATGRVLFAELLEAQR